MFHQHSYGTDRDTGLLDYDAIAAVARDFRPLIIVAATRPIRGGSTSRRCGTSPTMWMPP